jgi:hypothetical protein
MNKRKKAHPTLVDIDDLPDILRKVIKQTQKENNAKCTCGSTAFEKCPKHPEDTWYRDF